MLLGGSVYKFDDDDQSISSRILLCTTVIYFGFDNLSRNFLFFILRKNNKRKWRNKSRI